MCWHTVVADPGLLSNRRAPTSEIGAPAANGAKSYIRVIGDLPIVLHDVEGNSIPFVLRNVYAIPDWPRQNILFSQGHFEEAFGPQNYELFNRHFSLCCRTTRSSTPEWRTFDLGRERCTYLRDVLVGQAALPLFVDSSGPAAATVPDTQRTSTRLFGARLGNVGLKAIEKTVDASLGVTLTDKPGDHLRRLITPG